MPTLYYIIGKEAVEELEDSFESFLKYLEEEYTECVHAHEYETETEMHHFISGLSEMGYENYSILDDEQMQVLREREVVWD